MFAKNDIVRVLLPVPRTAGFDYRLNAPANIGDFVRVSFLNKKTQGVIIAPGTAALDAKKIKDIEKVFDVPGLSQTDIDWIMKISDWTMMEPGAVLRLILNVDLEEPKRAAKPLEIPEYHDAGNITLTPDQAAAASAVAAGDKFKVHLLDGITGSGKTQVYFDMAMRVYEAGRQVLIMMPEIALTAQFIKKFENKFGAKPFVWHSNQTPAARKKIWRAVAGNEIKIIIGTRSALFLPWKNLGLIVVDEEHDGSYKQEEQGSYHARDMAVLRAKMLDIPIVLASATPSVETLRNVADGKYSASVLPSRFGGASLPSVEIVDLRKLPPCGGVGDSVAGGGSKKYLSKPLLSEISETLKAGQQIMLFLNRRGFSPNVFCESCGAAVECPDCSVGMTYHQRFRKMLCHYCGRRMPVPAVCPKCGKAEMQMEGAGVEKIEKELREYFPSARMEILSSDTAEDLAGIVSRIENHETDIIIGTQILAKGHHFPNITLVGVIDADAGLYGNDFRAAEKTFQQLFQVSGRAGRGEIPGKVMLQTYNPENPVLLAIKNNRRDEVVNTELKNRAAANMPPFGQLIAVIVESDNETKLTKYCDALRAAAPNIAGAKIAGPVPAQMYQVRNWFRMRFLVHGREKDKLQPIIKKWIESVKAPSNTRAKLDVNPQNFL
ncbi:MAG: primosomal protein N' [Rickettsiales bacterium]|jgi:primosomal protein N' (replication factor Y)|nr:primosomal protein N' [Rickettsiales bacterium]